MTNPVWLDVLPKLDKFGGALSKGTKSAAKKAGTDAGKAFSDAAGTEVSKADAGAKYIADLEKNVERAKMAVGKEKVAISAARQAQVDATVKAQKAEAELDKARQQTDPGKLALAEAKLETAKERQRAASEKLERQDRILAAAQNELKTASSQLERATAATADELRDLERAAGRADDGFKQLDRAASSTGSELRQTGKAADAAGSEAKESGAEAESSSGGWTVLVGAVGALTGALAGLADGYADAMDGVRSQGQLQAALGLDPAEAQAAGGTASAAWSNGWGENLDEATNTTKLAYQFLGEGPDTQWATEASLAYQQAFGTDSQANITAVSQMLRTGLAPDAKTAFDIMTRGAQLGADKSGDLADTFTEYGTQFRKLGIDGPQAMGLLVQGLNNGARDADKVADAFKEFSIRAVDGSDTTADAFRRLGLDADDMQARVAKGGKSASDATALTLDKLRQIKDPAERAQIAVGLFGTQAEDLGDALYSLDLDTATAELGDFTGSTDAMKSALNASADPIDRVGRMLGGIGTWLGSKTIPYVNQFLDGVQGIFTLLTTGDFTGADNLFGFEEDSAFVSFLFQVRDVGLWAYENVLVPIGAWMADHQGLIATVLGGLATAFGLVAAVLGGGALAGVIGGFVAGLSEGVIIAAAVVAGVTAVTTELTAFFTQTDLGRQIVSNAWLMIQGAAQGFYDWWTTTGWPAIQFGIFVLQSAFAAVAPVVLGVFTAVGTFIATTWTGVIWPALQQFSGFLQDTVFPILTRLWVEYVQPLFLAIGGFIAWTWGAVIAPALTALSSFIANDLGPWLTWLWSSVVSPAFSAIGSFISWTWNSVIFPALDALKFFATQILAPAISWLWTSVVSPAFAGISWAVQSAWSVIQVVFAAVKWVVENVVAPVFTWLWHTIIEPAWDGIQSTLKSGYDWVKDNVFTPLKNFISDEVAPGFTTGVDAVASAWDGLKAAAAKPVKFVIEDVINKSVIDPFNTVAGFFDVDPITRLTMPASLTGYATGGWTGPGSKHQPAGVVHADEFVIRKESQNDLRRNAPGLLDSLNRYGSKALGYAGGGLVAVKDLAAEMGLRVTSGFRDGATTSSGSKSLHSMGKAFDFAASADKMMAFFNAVDARFRPTELLFTPAYERNIHRDGRRYANTGTVKDLHWSHVHVGMLDDAAAAVGGGGFSMNPFDGLWASIQQTVRDGVGDSKLIGDLLFNVPKKLIDSASEFVKGFLGDALEVPQEIGETALGAGRWTPVATEALIREGQMGPMRLAALLRRMKQESNFNPNAVNNWDSNAKKGTPSKGLMQVIGPTFAAYRDKSLPNNIFDPLANIVASIRYTLARYGDLEKGWNRKGGYAGGGLVKPMLYDEGGLLQPGLTLVNNASGKPEPVFTNGQGKSIVQMLEHGGSRGPSITVPITATQLADADVDRLATEIIRRIGMSVVEVSL